MWYFLSLPFLILLSADAMEQSVCSLPGEIVSLAVLPHDRLRDRWESLGITPEICRDPLVRVAVNALHIGLSVRAAAQESAACTSGCHYQFCYRSYGCLVAPLGVVTMVGLYADISPVAKVLLATTGSLGIMTASFVSFVHCARDYSYEDDGSVPSELRVVIADIKTLLDRPRPADQV